MISIKTRWMVAALGLSAAAWMIPGAARADMVGPFVQCNSVSTPAALATCASSQDPLTSGNAVIDDEGNLDVQLEGAAASNTYTIVFRTIDGKTINLGTLSTGAGGNGSKSKYAALPFGKNAAGFIVLQRNGDQFVTSLFVRSSSSETTRASFQVDLMSCSAVNDPDTISGCGTDAFKSGSVNVNSDTGDITIQVNGAEADATYNVVLRGPNGGTPLSLGSVGPTNNQGDATADMNTPISASTIAVGTIVVTNASSSDTGDQAYGGIRVTQKEPKVPEAGAHLVKCDDVNFPGPNPVTLETCGSDPLTNGTADVSTTGNLSVSLTGAAANTTYDIFFRPLDTTGSNDFNTGLSINTGSNGDGKVSGAFATSGDIGAGTFVVKNAGTDEFFSGFSVK